MTPIGAVHVTFSLVAIGSGGVVLRTPKGTRWHRTLGHLYAMSMAGVTATAFALYNLTGSFGPFHVAALVGGFTLVGGLFTVLGRRPRKHWIHAHAIWMSWSYIGLMAALVAESLTRFVMPRVAPYIDSATVSWTVFWTTVVGASLGVVLVGWRVMKARLPEAVRRTPDAMRREKALLRELEGVAP